MEPIKRVLVTLITYRRPKELRRMLESIDALQTQIEYRVLVVDNDPAGSAKPVVMDYSDRVEYLHETTPGIAAARNRCITGLREIDDAIVFLDDDEVVTPPWLDELVRCANLYQVGVVAGAVLSRLPPSAPQWIVDGNFFQRRIRKTGQTDSLPATNNVLVRAEVLRAYRHVRFDGRFSFTGGSDSEFFSRLKKEGVKVVWSEEAVVVEYVQTERVNLRWLLRRYTRGGETSARIRLRTESRLKVVTHGLFYFFSGLIIAPLSICVRPNLRGRNVILVGRGVGLVRGSLGLRIEEYSRKAGV